LADIGYLGKHYTTQATFTDKDGTLFDPDSLSAKLYDPDDTLQDTDSAPVKQSTGIYWAVVEIPAAGEADKEWTIVWEITEGSQKEAEKYKFMVEALP